MAVTVSGMFGSGHTYFADSPVVIDIWGLEWSRSGGEVTSPFTIVRVEVVYQGAVVGEFHADTGGQTEISFDISSALRAIWAEYDFSDEVAAARGGGSCQRAYRSYSLVVYTEYIDSSDGEFITTKVEIPGGGQCMTGGLTEMERATIGDGPNADASYWENSNPYNGDASTKPSHISPERVGRNSLTSRADVSNAGTSSTFYVAGAAGGPTVLRDSIPYQDFLFVNRRGAVETCSALMKPQMNIDVETKQYNRTERPKFAPSRSLMTVAGGGRRSWSMSSGHITREWAEWWTLEFLKAKRVWMWYKPTGSNRGSFVPVIVTPAKKSTGIYDKAKQQMPSVEFTVTMALEG